MERKIYLINETDNVMPESGKIFVGTQDPKISKTGSLRSHLLSYFLKELDPSVVFTSPMKRCTSIAEMAFDNFEVNEALADCYLGKWQEYDLDYIKVKFNKLYRDWIEDPDMVPPEGEDLDSRAERLEHFINFCISSYTGDIVIISHSNIIRPYLCKLQGLNYSQINNICIPYCSISTLIFDDNKVSCENIGIQYIPELTEDICISIDRFCGLNDDEIENCIEVSKLAVCIGEELSLTGLLPDIDSIRAAALLKNLCGHTKEDAIDSSMIIEVLGYPVPAYAVRNHLNLHFTNIVNEGTILYIANRLVNGNKQLTLAELFETDFEFYKSTGSSLEEMKEIHTQDSFISGMINRLCDKQVIK